MQITKIGHCCLIVKEDDTSIMTDPGKYSTGYDSYDGIDAVLITHEHGDHCHTDGVKEILAHNPNATVYANASVGKLLDEAGILYTLVSDGDVLDINGVSVEAYDYDHEVVHESMPLVQNTGFRIAERFYYGGDSLNAPDKPIDILALPVAGPWMRMRDAFEFCLSVKPKVAFPVHDGILVGELGGSHRLPGKILPEHGIEWVIPTLGETYEL